LAIQSNRLYYSQPSQHSGAVSLMDFTGYVPNKSYRVGSSTQNTFRYYAGVALGAIGGPSYTSTAQTSFTTWNTGSGRPMLDLEGYFYTTYTGEHRLKIISTDIAYLWIGSNAISYEFNKGKTYGNTPTFGDNTPNSHKSLGINLCKHP